MMKRIIACLMLAFAVCCIAVAVIAAEPAAESAPVGADVVAQLLLLLPASWEGWITLVVTVCAMLAAVIPRPKEGANILWRCLYGLMNAIGCNVGRAKNASAAKAVLTHLKK